MSIGFTKLSREDWVPQLCSSLLLAAAAATSERMLNASPADTKHVFVRLLSCFAQALSRACLMTYESHRGRSYAQVLLHPRSIPSNSGDA